MARIITALVKPALLVWARERAGLSVASAAKKAEVESELLRSWENGTRQASIAQVRKLGEIYKRPLAVFFLQEPPTDFDAQKEFRRIPGVTPEKESPSMRAALRTALFRREVAKEIYQLLGEDIPSFDATADPGEDPSVVGNRVRELLGVDWKTQLDWGSPYTALNAWRASIERLGVLVFQTSEIPVEEMRGISILHGPLPVILLNSSDSPHGRIFTLVHEFCHLLLATGGHQTSALEGKLRPEDQVLERISNRFAAAAILPRAEFTKESTKYPGAKEGEEDALRKLAARVKASPEAILRRLVELHLAPREIYKVKRRDWQGVSWISPSSSKGGPTHAVKVVAAAGKPFVSLVLDGYKRSVVSSADVTEYLGTQLKFLDGIAKVIAPGPRNREQRA